MVRSIIYQKHPGKIFNNQRHSFSNYPGYHIGSFSYNLAYNSGPIKHKTECSGYTCSGSHSPTLQSCWEALCCSNFMPIQAWVSGLLLYCNCQAPETAMIYKHNYSVGEYVGCIVKGMFLWGVWRVCCSTDLFSILTISYIQFCFWIIF